MESSTKMPSGADYPQIGLGTWQANGDDLKIAVKEALQIGYRHVDGAYGYSNEDVLGEVFKDCFDSGILSREELFYTSKVPQQAHRRDKVKEYLELSLKNLGFDYVDLYLIHFPVSCQFVENILNWPSDGEGNILLDEDVDFMETWAGMEDCVDAGLAKHIGLSNFNAEQVQYIYDNARIKPANLQVECHIYLQQQPLLELCNELGMTFTAYSSLGTPGAEAFISSTFGSDFKLAANVLEEPVLITLAEKYGKSVAQVALRFLVQRGMVVIPKSVNPARIEENFQLFDFVLEEEDMDAIKALDQGIRLIIFDFFKGILESRKYPF